MNLDLKTILMAVIFFGISTIIFCFISLYRANRRRRMAEKTWFEQTKSDVLGDLNPNMSEDVEDFLNKTGKKSSWHTFIAGMKNKIRLQYPRKILLPIEIGEPPCKNCRHWMPRVGDIREDEAVSVKICWGDMRSDFICFEEK